MAWEDKYSKHGGLFGPSKGNTKKISDERLSMMVELRKLGLTYMQIGEKLGVSHGTVHTSLRRHRPEALSCLNELIPIGYKSIKEYAEYYSVYIYTVRWYISSGYLPSVKIGGKIYVDLDTEPKRPKNISFEELETIEHLHELGVPASRIAIRVGRHPETLRRVIREYFAVTKDEK